MTDGLVDLSASQLMHIDALSGGHDKMLLRIKATGRSVVVQTSRSEDFLAIHWRATNAQDRVEEQTWATPQ